MCLSLCSFGHDFLSPVSSPRSSLRRVVRAFLAARRRWPTGRLTFRDGSICWCVGDYVGLMTHFGGEVRIRIWPQRWTPSSRKSEGGVLDTNLNQCLDETLDDLRS